MKVIYKRREVSLENVPADVWLGDWLRSSMVKPLYYELVLVAQDPYEGGKVGWWNGVTWDGLRLKEKIHIPLWKKMPVRFNEV